MKAKIADQTPTTATPASNKASLSELCCRAPHQVLDDRGLNLYVNSKNSDVALQAKWDLLTLGSRPGAGTVYEAFRYGKAPVAISYAIGDPAKDLAISVAFESFNAAGAGGRASPKLTGDQVYNQFKIQLLRILGPSHWARVLEIDGDKMDKSSAPSLGGVPLLDPQLSKQLEKLGTLIEKRDYAKVSSMREALRNGFRKDYGLQ